ncbi:hypothetical protein [Rossellomorea aquimaris]|uniref:Uncharacterized protein n=1 Tax=Rossellomorea aquimaris TaxID=189382 RepID=A0A1J6WP82_9BACI|nr:hypothetical protein [Rossellomorea aquimaris]OIU67641.1 hypothetical protein BHE18_12485 [Rossellomorea aquimaris]
MKAYFFTGLEPSPCFPVVGLRHGNTAKVVLYLLFQLNLGIFLGQMLELGGHPLLAVMMLLNGAVFLAAYKRHIIQYGAFLIGFLAFFSLTVIDFSLPLHTTYTALFFLTATGCIYFLNKWGFTFYWITSLVFWFMLIIQLYYILACRSATAPICPA